MLRSPTCKVCEVALLKMFLISSPMTGLLMYLERSLMEFDSRILIATVSK